MAPRAKPAQAKDATQALELRLAEALEQQAATNDILRLMASSPGTCNRCSMPSPSGRRGCAERRSRG
jgi:hypothetical protein